MRSRPVIAAIAAAIHACLIITSVIFANSFITN